MTKCKPLPSLLPAYADGGDGDGIDEGKDSVSDVEGWGDGGERGLERVEGGGVGDPAGASLSPLGDAYGIGPGAATVHSAFAEGERAVGRVVLGIVVVCMHGGTHAMRGCGGERSLRRDGLEPEERRAWIWYGKAWKRRRGRDGVLGSPSSSSSLCRRRGGSGSGRIDAVVEI
ncbi:hypothetical protein R3P38DRAFT_2758680 [Favolaschia claudopus]|uniref:Uncharacterized protein n=1 Tax=Favolaschia claudopus TaxID=2862362 RepID=A0AAW0EBK3_9AGAR